MTYEERRLAVITVEREAVAGTGLGSAVPQLRVRTEVIGDRTAAELVAIQNISAASELAATHGRVVAESSSAQAFEGILNHLDRPVDYGKEGDRGGILQRLEAIERRDEASRPAARRREGDGMKPDGIELGDLVRDKISGYTGVVVGRTEWLRGCDRVTVAPRELHEGKPIEPFSFDVPDVEIVEKHVIAKDEAPPERKTGGPRPTPSRGR